MDFSIVVKCDHCGEELKTEMATSRHCGEITLTAEQCKTCTDEIIKECSR